MSGNHDIFDISDIKIASNGTVYIASETKGLFVYYYTGYAGINNPFPENFYLSPNFPNPFNPKTTFYYSVSKPSWVTLKIYNLLGKEIDTLVDHYHEINTYPIQFNGSNLPSGIYLYQLKVGEHYSETKKMMLVK